MAHVHPSAVITGDVQLADDVVVGPYCVLAGTIRVGPATTLVSHVHLHGPLWMGAGNVCYPGVCLGFAPQDLKFDPAKPGSGLVIGERNTFREHVTISRATSDQAPTTIGSRNYWMSNSHAGHDVRVGDDCMFANGVLFGGFAQIGDRVVIGGGAGVHQFARVGRFAMISGLTGISADVPPFCMSTSLNSVTGLNVVGLRRGGVPRDTIDHIRWAFRKLYRRGSPIKKNVETLREREHVPEVREMLDFVLSARRAVADRLGRARHGSMQLVRAAAELDTNELT
ncbi:MAG: acyl-ACP--UDP-N-acetylglucosamine O-acyltransferase [Phycisphaerae bacterium]|nr:acyl-ACP--UDP-N-acetylglucosamine O-acyltransferase [Phycisphaerae bacterium]